MWIIGDSYVRRGAQRAAENLGKNIAVPDINVSWFGWGGLRWRGLLPFFFTSLRGRAAPDLLIIHCGGNDMGAVKSVHLVSLMKEDLHKLHAKHPDISICFSLINQRCQWKTGAKPSKIDKARRFVNSVMTTFVQSINGAVIEHPDIRHDSPGLFLADGVHFTPRGNDMFLENVANFKAVKCSVTVFEFGL